MNGTEVLQRFEALPFGVEVELGSLVMTIGEIFNLRPGAVLRTDHAAGAPFSMHVGGVDLATAEVVVIDDSVSVRITKLHENTKAPAASDGTN
jgi:flagellar motor switch/type III secretory pathway protein FliN